MQPSLALKHPDTGPDGRLSPAATRYSPGRLLRLGLHRAFFQPWALACSEMSLLLLCYPATWFLLRCFAVLLLLLLLLATVLLLIPCLCVLSFATLLPASPSPCFLRAAFSLKVSKTKGQ